MYPSKLKGYITVTLGDRAENGPGMQMIGKDVGEGNGLSYSRLKEMQSTLKEMGIRTCLLHLKGLLPPDYREKADPAYLLVGYNAAENLSSMLEMEDELSSLCFDTQALMRGRVKNKNARHNLCLSNFEQAANIPEGKGTVYNIESLPHLNNLRAKIEEMMGCGTLQGELNHYFNSSKCGIGWHGDSERRVVAAIRFGDSSGKDVPISYQWYMEGKPVGSQIDVALNPGDFYAMSEKAVGNDWRKRKRLTLRHAAGKKTSPYVKSKGGKEHKCIQFHRRAKQRVN